MKSKEVFSRDLWKWFLARAELHDVYGGWGDVPVKVSRHLVDCGIDYANSEDPDTGYVSEFDGTDNENEELPAIVAERWICNCRKYGGRYRGDAQVDLVLAVPGPYPLGRMIYEVIQEAGS
jgi:hypothetical protein